MWKNKKVSVVFSTYNEKESVRDYINETFKLGVVDEVIAINNNASKGTKEEIDETKAKQFFETKQGYGFGYRRALKEAAGDLIIMTEPDGSFLPKDIIKLLAYSDDFDVVFGTRTTDTMIWRGANMDNFLKWGNFFIAKMIEVLFNTTHLTDVGCTMRLINRKSLKKIQLQFNVGGSHFGPEFMLLVISNKIKFIEVPVNYKKRIGKSSVTGSKWKAFKLGLVMISLVLGFKMKSLFGKNRKRR